MHIFIAEHDLFIPNSQPLQIQITNIAYRYMVENTYCTESVQPLTPKNKNIFQTQDFVASYGMQGVCGQQE